MDVGLDAGPPSRVTWVAPAGARYVACAVFTCVPKLGSFTNNEKVQPTINLTHNNADRRFFLLADMLWQEDLPNNEFHTRYYDDGSVVLSQVPENREQYHYIINGGLDAPIKAVIFIPRTGRKEQHIRRLIFYAVAETNPP